VNGFGSREQKRIFGDQMRIVSKVDKFAHEKLHSL
jgi:hypothetical protein